MLIFLQETTTLKKEKKMKMNLWLLKKSSFVGVTEQIMDSLFFFIYLSHLCFFNERLYFGRLTHWFLLEADHDFRVRYKQFLRSYLTQLSWNHLTLDFLVNPKPMVTFVTVTSVAVVFKMGAKVEI